MTKKLDLQIISGRLERGEIDSTQYLEQLMRFVVEQIGCSRAALRVFVDTPEGCALRCVAMYDSNLDRMVPAADIFHDDSGRYRGRLQSEGSVTATSVRGPEANSGGLQMYFEEANVVALMDMSFSVNGELFGTFSCEQVGAPVDWNQRQLQALRKIASRASLTLMHMVSTSMDTAPGALWDASKPHRLASIPMPLEPIPDERSGQLNRLDP